MIQYVLTLSTALLLSGVAEYFSIMGLIAIFAAAPIPVAVMGISLGVAKLVAASWAYRNWSTAPSILKYYFTAAVVVLSLITSMGIFGYLSKAHMDQTLAAGDVQAKIAVYDEKIRIAKENIDANRKVIKQLDEAVDQVMARSKDEKGADKAVTIRRSQAKERARLISEIEAEQKKISQIAEERAPIAAEVRKVEAEVGPIKYIAALIYGDNPDTNLLERAVRWVIVTIVFVFDPLAILLLIAANFSAPIRKTEEAVSPDFNLFVTDTGKEVPAPSAPKEEWSPQLHERAMRDETGKIKIDKTRIHSIPKEILDKVFRK